MATMPQLPDPGSTPGEGGVPTLLAEVHAGVDRLLDAIARDERTAGRALRVDVAEVERLARRVDSARLRLVARADTVRVAERSGHTDTGAWLARTTNGDRRPASRDVHLAAALSAPTPPTPTDASATQPEGPLVAVASLPEPALAQTAAALDDGRISTDHAMVITRAMDDLPDHLGIAERRRCETELVRLAESHAPAVLRRHARRVIETVEPDEAAVDAHEECVVADEATRAMEVSAFWIKDNSDGTMTGHFTVPWASGMILKKVVDAMTAPRRQVQAGTGAVTTQPSDLAALTGIAAVDQLDWQHRRGLALADLLQRIPTDHLSSKVAATLLVTTRLDDLRGDLARVGRTDAGDVIDAGTVRRMACGAGVIPTVLDGASQPLDLGRQKRLHTEAQRVALTTRYDECAAEGCDRPFAWCEIHHLTAWAAGGRTDLDDGAPLCGRHHHMIDGSDWQHTVTRRQDRSVSIRFYRRT